MKNIIITPGEPAGIGPDLCIQLSQIQQDHNLVFAADPGLLQARAEHLDTSVSIREYAGNNPEPWQKGVLNILPVNTATTVQCGHLDPGNASYVLECIRVATQACLAGNFDALVTGPVHKGIINQAGISFSGHTEYLAELCATEKVVMMLATQGLRVALATTHLPLNKVSEAITFEGLEKIIRILHDDLTKRMNIHNPRIYVCGLNPHAGEDGHVGREEIEIIGPVMEKLRTEGFSLFGPLAADTLFTPKYLEQADVVLAMYHDQGLPVLKHMGFGKAVNITLGLPIIRTSVDHGTALPLAGSGKADISSLLLAIDTAAGMQ
jgi:4-hydroxythreonine-4-phosphate dehydrogenase